ncbi:MAG: LD-carboxypeptidase [Pseudomonadota bacterium]
MGVFAPAGVFDPARLEAGLERLRAWGFEPVPAPNLGRHQRYLAGTDAERLADLRWALFGEGLDAAWLARGGYGITRLLPSLPEAGFPRRAVLGFSDASALFAALWRRGAGPLVHGPVLQSLTDHTDPASQEALRALLCEGRGWSWPCREIIPGAAFGRLVGGNLCTLASLAGTPDALRAEGAIMILEEVGERPYRVDRLLTQLLGAGTFDGVAAVVLGAFVGCTESGQPDWDAEQIAVEVLGGLGVPVAAGLPVGHGPQNHAFCWGAGATLRDGVLSWGR